MVEKLKKFVPVDFDDKDLAIASICLMGTVTIIGMLIQHMDPTRAFNAALLVIGGMATGKLLGKNENTKP